jgi:hypothetical protein
VVNFYIDKNTRHIPQKWYDTSAVGWYALHDRTSQLRNSRSRTTRSDLLREEAGMANERLPTRDSGEPVVYQLRVKGHLGAQWGAWFGGMTVTQTANGETLITGLVADQAALYGLLRKVRDLGLPLLALSSSERAGLDGFAADSGDLPGA